MNFGSLFAGVGGFDIAAERAGMTCLWQVENNRDCIRVLEHHWPGSHRVADIRDAGKHNLEPVDVIFFGSPCQDLSVAGKRKGMAGERSGLFHEAIRIVRELRPAFAVWENVPGALSSNGGADFETVMDEFHNSGYVVDPQILDAQFFGLAQRRRRLFLVCVRLEDLMKKRIDLSRRILADLAAQQLRDIWGVIRLASSAGQSPSESASRIERLAALVRKRTSLLETALGKSASKKSAAFWEGTLGPFADGASSSECGLTSNTAKLNPTFAAEATSEFLLKGMESGIDGWQSMCGWLSKLSEEVCTLGKKSTISTFAKRTTEKKIFTFFLAALNINARIVRCVNWSESCWSVASSVLTMTEEFTNYARESASDLFGDQDLLHGWRAYFGSSSDLLTKIKRRFGGRRAGQILLESPCGCGHPPQGKKEGQEVAGTLKGGSGRRDWLNGGEEVDGHLIAYQSNGSGSERAGGLQLNASDDNGSNQVVAYTVNAAESCAKKDHTFETETARALDSQGGFSSNQGGNVIAFHATQDPISGQVSPALGANAYIGVTNGWRVRRLTPMECTRLMGLPDNHIDLTPPLSDSAKYRMLGNSVAVPVVEWIVKRILAAAGGSP